MTQTVCNLIQETMNDYSCDGLTTMPASEFQEMYEESHAEFCLQNAVLVASVAARTNPEAEQVYETALAEALFVIQAGSENNAATAEARRNLGFWDDVGDALGDIADDPWGSFKNGVAEMWNFSPELTIMIGMLCAVGLVVGGVYMFSLAVASGRGRRALTADADATSVAISTNDVLLECVHGIDSFLCDIPVNQLLQVFSTGVCASVPGLLCVVSPDDLLALGSN